MLFPPVYGFAVAGGYALRDPHEFFELELAGFPALLFPIVVSAAYLPRLADEWSNGFLVSARTRTTAGTYLSGRIWAAAMIAGVTLTVMVAIAAVAAFVVAPLAGIAFTGDLPGNTPHPPEEAFTFSQLSAVSPALMCVVYSLWVGLNASLYAAFGAVVLMLVENRFIALAAPTAWYWLLNLATALLGLEAFGPTTMVFPFNITQQPIWHAFIPFGVLLLVTVGLWRLVVRREFATAGLV